MIKRPIILNIESATGVCSVCISKGTEILAIQTADEVFQHAKVLTGLIGDCLKTSGLTLAEMDAVALSSGPGSYTSLRVGASTAKGICYALGKPLISVDTLQSLAIAAQKEMPENDALYCPMIDARRMEVYCNIFNEKGRPVSKPSAKVITESSFSDFFSNAKKMVFCGNGAAKCKEVIASPKVVFSPSECSAAYLPAISTVQFEKEVFEDVAYFTPLYLKPPNITTPKNMSLYKALKNQ